MDNEGFMFGLIGTLVLSWLLLWVLILPLHTNYICFTLKEQGVFENKRGDYFIKGKVYRHTLDGIIEIKSGDHI